MRLARWGSGSSGSRNAVPGAVPAAAGAAAWVPGGGVTEGVLRAEHDGAGWGGMCSSRSPSSSSKLESGCKRGGEAEGQQVLHDTVRCHGSLLCCGSVVGVVGLLWVCCERNWTDMEALGSQRGVEKRLHVIMTKCAQCP